MRNYTLALLPLLLILTVPASAGVVFDNFPINGTINAFNIYPSSVADSFTVSSDATVNGVNFGVWLLPDDSIITVGWLIGTAPFDDSIGFGTATVSSTYLFPGGIGVYEVYTAAFSFPDLNLAAGTYYLTLQDAVVSNGHQAFWDINNAPGVDAWMTWPGHLSAPGVCLSLEGVSGTCAESFQILGDVGGVPEPSTWALLGSGILAAFALRRKAIRR